MLPFRKCDGKAGALSRFCLDGDLAVPAVYKLFDQEKSGPAVCALGRDALFIDPVDQIRTDPAPGVLTGDDIAARVTVDPECDLTDLRTACGNLLDGIFEKISDDRDIVFDRKKEILFQTAAVRGDGEQDAELRGMHHFSDHKGADL